jgi:hypothetical protein
VAPQPVDLPWAPAPAPDAAPARSEDLAAAQDAAGSCTGGCVAEPPGCDPPIKGNVSVDSGARIYHVYGQEYYDETIINPRYGERWFCTEQEARDAGWRKAYR